MKKESPVDSEDGSRRRLAIIGGASSGLITLKYAIDLLDDWDIVCFERSESIVGCWGRPHPGFVSTSTKYTTQFACHRRFDASVTSDQGASRSEFFCDDEYGRYLEDFSDTFDLRRWIRLQTHVRKVRKTSTGRWELTIQSTNEQTVERFDAVIVCTGLTAVPSRIETIAEANVPSCVDRPSDIDEIRNRRVVVVGGGESAVDHAARLARPERNNEVFLSLSSGIRVSPRYHPIRGVPSDFLRNRLMLSLNPAMRNWIGERFVRARILHQEFFERWFPANGRDSRPNDECERTRRRKDWAMRLTKRAKDDLFNMFHNKSDDFLEAVAVQRIRIVGLPIDTSYQTCRQFDSDETTPVNAELVVPAIGFQSRLDEIIEDVQGMNEFYWGCCHVRHPDLFAIGFARPVIGNIPSISEMQARYVISILAERVRRVDDIERRNLRDRSTLQRRFTHADFNSVYPVEMFPYCDRLARQMGIEIRHRQCVSTLQWCRIMLSPASTLHYRAVPERGTVENTTDDLAEPIYMPAILIAILIALTPLSWGLDMLERRRKSTVEGRQSSNRV